MCEADERFEAVERAAHELFDRACSRYYARGFLLYEMYTRAAAFHETPQRAL